MICFDNLGSTPLIENQRVMRAARRADAVRMGVPLDQAAGRRGHPRNALSVSERVKPVRFYGSKRLSSQLAGNWKLNAGLPGRGGSAMSFFFGIASGLLICAWLSPSSVGRWFAAARKAFLAEVHKAGEKQTHLDASK